jgi:hypothetical protein
MLLANQDSHNIKGTQSSFFYGWVIVAVCALLLAMQAGVVYSFGVFFKHLVADFGWSRAATSGVFSDKQGEQNGLGMASYANINNTLH